MKKIAKKWLSVLLVLIMIISVSIPASAVISPGPYSGYVQVNHNGSYSYNSFNATLSWPNLTNKVRWTGNSTTCWLGSNPFNADSILHRNIINVTAIGGLSLSSSGGGGSISGSQMTDEMSVSNNWRVNSTYDYTLTASVFIFGTNFSSFGRVQIGSHFYSISCTT